MAWPRQTYAVERYGSTLRTWVPLETVAIVTAEDGRVAGSVPAVGRAGGVRAVASSGRVD
jgi:hypothetical protein